MKNTVSRSGWGTKKIIIEDLKCFPRFLVGLAPRYEGEYSSTFEGESFDPLYGGWSTFCGAMTIMIATMFVMYYLPDLLRNAHSVGAMMYISTILVIVVILMIGFILAQVVALPFLLLNSFFERQVNK